MDGIKCILLDIEGTVAPISFVKATLFPYAIKALPNVLAARWDDPEFKQYRDAFPEEHRKTPKDLQTHVEDLTKRDVKIAYLKNLQGYLWQDGYESGAYSTPLFPDVAPQLRQWKKDGLSLSIYSSGSVFAQKLLFGHVQQNETPASSSGSKRGRLSGATEVQASNDDEPADEEPPRKKKVVEASGDAAADDVNSTSGESGSHQAVATTAAASDDAGKALDAADAAEEVTANQEQAASTEDLTALFDGWFDTTNAGLKTEASSYATIAEELKWKPEEILFLSDNVKEIDAAHEAELNAILVDRPGNAELAFADRSRLQIVESLGEVYINKGTGTEVGKEEE
ncbi:putative HAD superfamily, enolase-phosphatase E1 [Septoria linicola]|nr:putative HAD superfamily, enolase-phosphatase E1 [Septoria linicola]